MGDDNIYEWKLYCDHACYHSFADVTAIPGWEIHNKRVELGQDGSNGPAFVNNRDNNAIANTIAGYPIPEDLSPRPFKNAVPALVVEPSDPQQLIMH